MNANELADWLNDPLGYKMGEIAKMLRQQQAEIEALKSKMSLNSYDEGKNVVNQLFKVKIFRDIDGLKIWDNENGFRFHRDPDDKTKYKVCFTDDDVDKLETFVRQQQAEIEALHNLVKEQDKKIIDLAFDLAYANRTDEWLKETDEQVISNAEKRFPFLKKESEK